MKIKTIDIVLVSAFTALHIISAWITVPAPVPFTMQIFSVFLAAKILGSRRSILSVVAYILLGLLGLPVFSGFQGGISALLCPSGGFILGFIPAAALAGSIDNGNSLLIKRYFIAFLSLICCYFVGTVWFCVVYEVASQEVGVFAAILTCVVPFIIPDVIKVVLADITAARLKKYIDNSLFSRKY